MPRHQRFTVVACLAALSVAICGCSLFESDGSLYEKRSGRFTGQAGGLPPIPTARDAVHLEVIFVERPAGDSLLGDALWNEVDQVGTLTPETQLALRKNGFRIGLTGSAPPRALEQLLGLKSGYATADGEQSQNLVGHRIVLASGAETEVQAGDVFPRCSVDIEGSDGIETKEFANARFVFRLKVTREQDGWARLEFLPEIHHGGFQLRPVAGNNGWQLRTTQDIYPLYAQRFTLLLNVGEMVLISADDGKSQSVGRRFFFGRQANMQRLLVIRLAGMTRSDPVYAE